VMAISNLRVSDSNGSLYTVDHVSGRVISRRSAMPLIPDNDIQGLKVGRTSYMSLTQEMERSYGI
jgi:hypothetical protein